ncbi:hypothetical protein D3C81_1836980 [compost metagenome]
MVLCAGMLEGILHRARRIVQAPVGEGGADCGVFIRAAFFNQLHGSQERGRCVDAFAGGLAGKKAIQPFFYKIQI